MFAIHIAVESPALHSFQKSNEKLGAAQAVRYRAQQASGNDRVESQIPASLCNIKFYITCLNHVATSIV